MSRRHVGRIVLSLVVVIGCLVGSVERRRNSVYRDLPEAMQTADAGQSSSQLWGIRTNPNMSQAIADVQRCLRSFPASQLAVIPDGAIIPVLVDRANPLPVDWWYPKEVVVPRQQILRAVGTATKNGDYLILFETLAIDHLASAKSLPGAQANSQLFDYPEGYAKDLFDQIPGRVVTCGSFVGRYATEPMSAEDGGS